VASTEKIRHWDEQTLTMEELEGRLKTKVKKSPEDPGYFGLADEEALDIL
jgi:sodium/potassium-transporting ATPase subunit alpha